jgi:hypothetical protein
MIEGIDINTPIIGLNLINGSNDVESCCGVTPPVPKKIYPIMAANTIGINFTDVIIQF